jgi:hypothetical protein
LRCCYWVDFLKWHRHRSGRLCHLPLEQKQFLHYKKSICGSQITGVIFPDFYYVAPAWCQELHVFWDWWTWVSIPSNMEWALMGHHHKSFPWLLLL